MNKTVYIHHNRIKKIITLVSCLIIVLCLSLNCASAEESFPLSKLKEQDIPAYTEGSDYYLDINDGIPDFAVWQHTTFPFVLFSELDELGRTGPAYACLGPETLPKDVRKPIGNVTPSGWQSTRYEDLVDGGNLFNRSHLIGFLLCGDNGSPENLITGTRLMNAGSMVMVETAIEMYIEETGHHVLYRVTPFYHGDDLVPFGVQIEALSMETDVDGICCNLFLYNIQPGIEIDYATGESRRTGTFFALDDFVDGEEEAIRSIPAEETEPEPEPESITVTYVLNKNTGKFHYPDCKSVGDMKAKNRMDVDWTRERVIAEGYQPCGNCKP
ncbi:MAG: DNA/RNA non-specific endonuclease [Oscillospiraceae bacterium]|nr:DNA/RNA non-specific endonuclease [Oscillospiraceae bacterium]